MKILLTGSILLITSCASSGSITNKTHSEVPTRAGKSVEWDYKRIRAVRAAEADLYNGINLESQDQITSKGSK